MLIDVSPTFSYQLMRDGMDITHFESLLFTHTHPDHFNVGELFSRMEGYGFEINHPLHIFGNDRAINGCIGDITGYTKSDLHFIVSIPSLRSKRNGYKITPLLIMRKWELCYVYHIEKDGKAIFLWP